jgi:hypothetical protein
MTKKTNDIKIAFVPLEKMRYESLGDYFYKDGILHFKIVDTGNPVFNKIILCHELIEQTLTEAKGIKEEQILKYDLEFENLRKAGKVGEDDEPGEGKGSPYRREHILAEIVERMMLNHLDQKTFSEYTELITKVFENADN